MCNNRHYYLDRDTAPAPDTKPCLASPCKVTAKERGAALPAWCRPGSDDEIKERIWQRRLPEVNTPLPPQDVSHTHHTAAPSTARSLLRSLGPSPGLRPVPVPPFGAASSPSAVDLGSTEMVLGAPSADGQLAVSLQAQPGWRLGGDPEMVEYEEGDCIEVFQEQTGGKVKEG